MYYFQDPIFVTEEDIVNEVTVDMCSLGQAIFNIFKKTQAQKRKMASKQGDLVLFGHFILVSHRY